MVVATRTNGEDMEPSLCDVRNTNSAARSHPPVADKSIRSRAQRSFLPSQDDLFGVGGGGGAGVPPPRPAAHDGPVERGLARLASTPENLTSISALGGGLAWAEDAGPCACAPLDRFDAETFDYFGARLFSFVS